MGAPEAIQALARERLQARADRDFSRADALREAITASGWKVVDTADGFELVAKPPFDSYANVGEIPPAIVVDAALVITVLLDGWPDDAHTCVSALLEHAPENAAVLLLDLGNVDDVGLRAQEWANEYPERVCVIHLEQTLEHVGWAHAVSAAIDVSGGEYFAVMDMSTVLEGAAFDPIVAELQSSGAAGSGWKGVNVDVDDAWRSFTPARPGEVDAILGYLMVFRRSVIAQVRPDSKARFYRNADMEWSLAVREAGGRLRIPEGDLPVRQDRHHGYHDSDANYRDKQSKKTYDRLLQRFRGRDDILSPR